MLAVADGSLTIYVDDRKPQQYDLREGLDLTWRVKNKVKVESVPGVARFWLSGQELDVGSLDSFQLQPVEGE